jgi:hypothetical protein
VARVVAVLEEAEADVGLEVGSSIPTRMGMKNSVVARRTSVNPLPSQSTRTVLSGRILRMTGFTASECSP